MAIHKIIALLLLLLPAPAAAAAEGRLQLVTGNDYPPFTDQSLPHGGLATEIVSTVFNEMGYDVDISYKPWKRGYAETLNKRYLGTFPYGKNPQRLELFHYSAPLYVFAQHFFATDAAVEFNRDEDLQGLRVCVPIGYNLVRLEDLVARGIVTLEQPVDADACFGMLKRGRVDLVRIDRSVGWAIIDKLYGSADGFRMLPKPFRETVEHLIIAKDYPGGKELLDAFDLTFARLSQQGVIDAIKQRHLGR